MFLAIDRLVELSRDVFTSLGASGLFIIAFIESSFFPVPPDLILIPLILLNPAGAVFYVVVCTAGSVLGALFGYWIGVRGGRPLLTKLASKERIESVESRFNMYGALAVGVAGFSPIPYKIFTITAGVLGLDKTKFVLASVISRGSRFALEAIILVFFGEKILTFIQNWFGVLTLAIAAIVAVVWLWLKRL